MFGLPTLAVPARPEITAGDGGGSRTAAHVYEAGVPAGAATRRLGIPLMTVARTVVDVCRHSRADGIVVADAALRAGLVTRWELAAALGTAYRWPGVIAARDVVGLADPAAESPIESVLRLRMHDDGFPPPVLQYPVGPYFADLALPRYGLLIEADGRVKYHDDALWKEKRREHEIRAGGWWIERVVLADLFARWPVTSRRLEAAMRPNLRRLPA